MSNILGISCGFHDAGVTVIDQAGFIRFASHSERFSKKKHDPDLCYDILQHAKEYGDISTVAYYENHWLKKYRQLRAGQKVDRNFTLKSVLRDQFRGHEGLLKNKLVSFGHHKSHAAAGFQTSSFSDATVVVIDAIGELDTISIWTAEYNWQNQAKYKLRWRKGYPHSIGLFYSAMTKRVGLRPLDEEYILMGMSAYGKPSYSNDIMDRYIDSLSKVKFKENMHLGVPDDFLGEDADHYDIARSSQDIVEQLIYNVMSYARVNYPSSNLVYAGGVALNCLANRNLGRFFKNVWIMPNPGDAGSSLGAAALVFKKKIEWTDANLGYHIDKPYPVKELLNELQTKKIVGVASGKAEFGPRAFGNRSLLADPRGTEIKDKVNDIKRRQHFRPFAPVILEEFANEYFDMPRVFEKSPYMQAVALCKKPEEFPAIIHKDGTSRVQTVPNDGSGIRQLLEQWLTLTGCPLLLNTSLNIRGEPMVNDLLDAQRFEEEYGIKVYS
jgi:carbamoyltransferase